MTSRKRTNRYLAVTAFALITLLGYLLTTYESPVTVQKIESIQIERNPRFDELLEKKALTESEWIEFKNLQAEMEKSLKIQTRKSLETLISEQNKDSKQ